MAANVKTCKILRFVVITNFKSRMKNHFVGATNCEKTTENDFFLLINENYEINFTILTITKSFSA